MKRRAWAGPGWENLEKHREEMARQIGRLQESCR